MEKNYSYAIKLVVKVMFVLLFGFIAAWFVQSGEEARLRILATESAQTDARIALDHINDMLRTNDVVGRVEIAYVDRVGRASILIRHRTAAYNMDRWIYFEDGRLLEAQVLPGEQPSAEYTIIAGLYDFQIVYDSLRSVVVINIAYEHSGGVRRITTVVGLRSDRTEGVVIL